MEEHFWVKDQVLGLRRKLGLGFGLYLQWLQSVFPIDILFPVMYLVHSKDQVQDCTATGQAHGKHWGQGFGRTGNNQFYGEDQGWGGTGNGQVHGKDQDQGFTCNDYSQCFQLSFSPMIDKVHQGWCCTGNNYRSFMVKKKKSGLG